MSFTLAFRKAPGEARIGDPEGDLAPCSLVSQYVTGSDGPVTPAEVGTEDHAVRTDAQDIFRVGEDKFLQQEKA